ncbi:MAG: aminotransferase class I/II-fold pyridoxal phosphate-dependent enzyme [Lachnospiraceae bacterium]
MSSKEKYIFEALEELRTSDIYPFHMPGHKRNMANHLLSRAYGMDITEIDGFDNLHEPQGLILEAMNRAKRLYGTKETFFLVNGSTAGILTAIHACVPYGGKIIVSRNSHKSVYNAIALLNLETVYLYPARLSGWELAEGLSIEEVERAIGDNPDAGAILVTSPTYEGFISPIEPIAKLAHAAGIPLIVDEAHGAHFPFFGELPESAINQGADLVIQSLHKTMPAFTQTALLHFQGNLVQLRAVKRYLSIFQSSSPSYLLMGGIDFCLELVEKEGQTLWKGILDWSDSFYEKAKELKHIRVWCGRKGNQELLFPRGEKQARKDPLKLILMPKAAIKEGKPYTGIELYHELLDRYHLQMEMVTPAYVLAILTCMDVKEGLERLEKALFAIDKSLEFAATDQEKEKGEPFVLEAAEPIGEAMKREEEWVLLHQAGGRECAAYINLYPPGIPLIVPGEVISRDLVATLLTYSKQDLPLQGLKGDKIPVIKRE